MDMTVCANCNTEITPGQNYCGTCGQKARFHRFTSAHVTHEFFHAFTHADGSIVTLAKALARNPGRVTTEYVEGKVRKYFNPFSFLLICVAFFVLVNNAVKTYPNPPQADPNVVNSIPTPEGKKAYLVFIKRNANASVAMSKHTNIITIIAIPFYALIVWLFFKRRGRNFAEIMIAMVFFTAFSTLVTTAIFNPLLAYYKGTTSYFYIFLIIALLQTFYYTWGLKYFLRFRTALGYIKVWPVMVLTSLLWMIITLLVMLYYVYREKMWKVIPVLWDAMVKAL